MVLVVNTYPTFLVCVTRVREPGAPPETHIKNFPPRRKKEGRGLKLPALYEAQKKSPLCRQHKGAAGRPPAAEAGHAGVRGVKLKGGGRARLTRGLRPFVSNSY